MPSVEWMLSNAAECCRMLSIDPEASDHTGSLSLEQLL